MKNQEFKNKKILIVGMARSGLAATTVLFNLGAEPVCQDSKPENKIPTDIISYLKKKDIEYHFGTDPEVDDFDLIVVSPGVPLNIKLLKSAKEKGIKIIGELELAYELSDANFVSITGTNGKTTTTTLVGEMFKNGKFESEVAGNIGLPVTEKSVKARKDSWLIVETSSFQAETIDEFHPKVSALLNLVSDHLDRHKTFRNYAMAKARIFENQNEEDFAVVNADDNEVMKLVEGIKAEVVPFSGTKNLNFGAFIHNDEIVIKNKQQETTVFCKVRDLKIPGKHNVENALAATAIAYFSGVDENSISKTLKSFAGVEHRIEKCATVNGITYYNDSKGTNPDAAIKAIQAIEGNIILIAGGYDKGADFSEFIRSFGDKVKHVVLMGKTAVKIKNACEKSGFEKTIIVKDMEDCVREATRLAEYGDSVLLSPACASWDMYDSFEQRGRHFKECIRKLEKEK